MSPPSRSRPTSTNATPLEQMQLTATSGMTLTELHAGRVRPYAPETVEKVRARIRRRRRLGFRHVDCLTKDCDCGSLTRTLDELDESATKAEITKAARALHKSRNPKFAPLPVPPVEPEPSEPRAAPVAPAAPIPAAVVSETSTKPFRAIRKRKRWYDDDRGVGGITGMKF
jgi:hypothetical protein